MENVHAQPEQTLVQASVPAANLAQVPSPPPFLPMRVVTYQDQNMTECPLSTDSKVDVTAYATEIVQLMEAAQTAVSPVVEKTDESGPEATSGMEGLSTPPLLVLGRLAPRRGLV